MNNLPRNAPLGHLIPVTKGFSRKIRAAPVTEIPSAQAKRITGRYIGQLGDKVEGRRFVELLGSQDDHVWRMFEEEQVSHDKDLLLGDEPLQGAEDLKK